MITRRRLLQAGACGAGAAMLRCPGPEYDFTPEKGRFDVGVAVEKAHLPII